VEVVWDAPLDLGGEDVAFYAVQQRLGADASANWTTVGVTPGHTARLNVTVWGNETYHFRVRANNTAGDGAWSEEFVYVSVMFESPSSPFGLVNASVPSAGGVVLNWTAPTWHGAAPIQGYVPEILDLTSHAASWTTVEGFSTLRPYPHTTFFHLPLAANMSVSVRVRATNGLLGPPSDHINVTTAASSRPGPPRNVLVSSTTGGVVSVVWAPPVDTGGVPVTKYMLTYDQRKELGLEPLVIVASMFTSSVSMTVQATGYSFTEEVVEYSLPMLRCELCLDVQIHIAHLVLCSQAELLT